MATEEDPYGGDALLQDCVERALAPHRDRLSPPQLLALRDYLIVFVTTHPAAEPLHARLRRRPAVQRSTLVEGQSDVPAAPSPSRPVGRKARRG